MLKLVICCALFSGAYAYNHGQDLVDFNNFVDQFNKSYATTADRNNANYYFIYHRNLITDHNAKADRKVNTYRVKINQFSDIRLITFAARLPKAVYPTVSHSSTPVQTNNAGVETNFNMLTEFNINATAQDQGTLCSSSWAYSVAKAIQILNSIPSITQPVNYSAQALIDCAGMGTACTTQVPQVAFDYLTQLSNAELLPQVDYLRRENGLQGMCLPSQSTEGIKLDTYATITDSDDASLKRFVSSSIPVIVEYNPATFGFMHYASGVYVPTSPTASSSQFLVVVGYGHDTESNLDYWLCLNSFGNTWGDNGFIKIARSVSKPIAKGAIFPNTLG